MRPTAQRHLVALAAALLVASPCWAGADPTSRALLFVPNRAGQAQIHWMHADGTGDHALTQGPAENTEPAWSPDGRHVAFTSYRDGNAEIYLMDASGANLRRLTSSPQADNAPSWLPDGRIVFRSMRDGWANFYVVEGNGQHLRALTRTPSDKGAPVVSPDGRWIAYVGHGEMGLSNIFVLPSQGGEAQNLTGALSKDQKLAPAWRPDSQGLAYVEYSGGKLGLRVIGRDGRGAAALTDQAFSNASPSWSPDGRRLVFVSSREGTRMDLARGDIYVMNADGSGAVNLTQHPAEDNQPVWSADGQTIYFMSLRDGPAQIYAVAADGGTARRLTHNAGFDLMVRPRPTPLGKPGDRALPLAPAPH